MDGEKLVPWKPISEFADRGGDRAGVMSSRWEAARERRWRRRRRAREAEEGLGRCEWGWLGEASTVTSKLRHGGTTVVVYKGEIFLEPHWVSFGWVGLRDLREEEEGKLRHGGVYRGDMGF
jgi:hypothetical protein